MYDSSQEILAPTTGDDVALEDGETTPEVPPIANLLRRLRGGRTLRQVENDTGISNSYLSNLEMGAKRPGPRILSRLASYYRVPLQDLLQVAGLPELPPNSTAEPTASIIELQRGYEFVMSDPNLGPYEKPAGMPPIDMQKFLVEMYQHYTGKKLL
jgi:transcriptional regulator with XRE-family HTH domain